MLLHFSVMNRTVMKFIKIYYFHETHCSLRRIFLQGLRRHHYQFRLSFFITSFKTMLQLIPDNI